MTDPIEDNAQQAKGETAAEESTAEIQARIGPLFRVTEAHLDDLEQGVARISGMQMAALNFSPGDVVRIEGERATVVRLWPFRPDDVRSGILAMDGLTRENAQLSIDERVAIRRQESMPAKTVLLTPLAKVTVGPKEVARIRQHLEGRPLMPGDKVVVPLFSRKGTAFSVGSFEPEAPCCFSTAFTDVRIQEQSRASAPPPSEVKYEDIGGLDEELRRMREMIELPMKYPELFARLRVEPPKGVLLYGPPGTGKTTIARAVASEVKAHFVRVNGPEIIHKFYGESEAKLRELFDEAQRKAPSIIFIDEIDALAPKRSEVLGEVEKRVVAQLLALMDGMVARGEVVVIGATNLPELLDHALRRPGRFDREVSVRVPDRPGRFQILSIHARGMPLADDVDLPKLAEVTHGYVGADLEVLCKEAGMFALQELLERDDFVEQEIHELAAGAQVAMRHFLEALKGIEPTATREFFAEKPNVRWDDVGGHHEAKGLLQATVELPRKYPRLHARVGRGHSSGVLVCGGPGSGKTLLVRALAAESGFNFISVDAAALFSKWVGESEKALRQVFVKAKQASPCIVFFDEIDTIFPLRDQAGEFAGRERLVGQFISELNGLDLYGEVVVIGATNRPELVDPAITGAGRLGTRIALQPPDAAARLEILRIHTRELPLADDCDLEPLANRCEGFSPSALAQLCQRAAMDALRGFIAEHGDASDDQAEAFSVGAAHLETAREALQSALPAATHPPTP